MCTTASVYCSEEGNSHGKKGGWHEAVEQGKRNVPLLLDLGEPLPPTTPLNQKQQLGIAQTETLRSLVQNTLPPPKTK